MGLFSVTWNIVYPNLPKRAHVTQRLWTNRSKVFRHLREENRHPWSITYTNGENYLSQSDCLLARKLAHSMPARQSRSLYGTGNRENVLAGASVLEASW